MATKDTSVFQKITVPDLVHPRFVGLGLFVAGWYLLAWVFPNELMPYPIETILLAWELTQSGIIFTHLVDTLYRTLLGFAGAMVLGIFLGVVMGTNRFSLKFFSPYIIIGLSIPAIAWAAIGTIIFGFSILSPVVATIAVTFPFVAINVWKGVENINADLVKMSQAFGVSNSRLVRRLILPNAAPELFSGVRFGMAISWKIVTIAELFAASSGVGYKLVQAYERYQFERAWAWAVVFMIVVLAIEYFILRPLERRAYQYRQDAELKTLL
jgi:ABC-type nitrate/sulfonate/bicarbonate transport system permease component